MLDLRQYTVKEFAEAINENAEVIKELMANNRQLKNTDKPYLTLSRNDTEHAKA